MIAIEKKSDGGIKIHVLHEIKFQKDVEEPFLTETVVNGKTRKFLVRNFTDCLILKDLNPDDYFFVDENPKSKDLESRKQLYWENDADGNPQVKVDTNWENRLMPDQLIKKKHLARLSEKLSASLEENSPDPIECLKLQHKIELCKSEVASIHNENCFWTQIAIDGLDEKVAKGESDKPLIRQKLQEKISELNN